MARLPALVDPSRDGRAAQKVGVDDQVRFFLQQQFLELYGVAGAGFEGLAVFAQDGTEPDMGEFDMGFRMPAAEHGEELLKMELLRGTGDIDDLVRVPGFQPMGQRC